MLNDLDLIVEILEKQQVVNASLTERVAALENRMRDAEVQAYTDAWTPRRGERIETPNPAAATRPYYNWRSGYNSFTEEARAAGIDV